MSKEITKTTGGELVNSGSSVRYGGRTDRDRVIPRANVLQERREGVEPGEVVHSLTMEVLTNKLFIPLFSYKSYAKFSSDLKLEWSTLDVNDPRVMQGLKWGNSGDKIKDKPKITEFFNFVVVFEDSLDSPLVMSFKGSALKDGRKLDAVCVHQSGLVSTPGIPLEMYGNKHRYQAVVKSDLFGKKTYWYPSYSLVKSKEEFNVSEEIQRKLSQVANNTASAILLMQGNPEEILSGPEL